jgi:hypothetical protein
MNAREVVRAHGGDWCGSYGLVPGPGHSPKDRSLKVWDTPNGVRVHSFAGDAWKDCRTHLGLDDDWRPERRPSPGPARSPSLPARPTARVRDLLRTATTPDLVPDVGAYLKSRKLWPLPKGCSLKAHAGAPYWDAGDPPILVGRFPALLAEVRDCDGELVTVQVTYLQDGRKLSDRTPRKLLSPTTGRTGCAVRLVPAGPVLAVAEGIETALAAQQILRVPVWAAPGTALFVAFVPPEGVKRLVIAADRDVAGLTAAWKLRDRLDFPMELRVSRMSDFAEEVAS